MPVVVPSAQSAGPELSAVGLEYRLAMYCALSDARCVGPGLAGLSPTGNLPSFIAKNMRPDAAQFRPSLWMNFQRLKIHPQVKTKIRYFIAY